MRVLYVLRYWPTRSETFVSGEIAELRRRGVDVVVAAIDARDDGAGLDPVPGLEVWRPPRGLGRPRAWRAASRVRARSDRAEWLDGVQRPKDTDRACWVAERGRGDFDRVHAHFAGEAAEWARVIAADWGVDYSVTVHASDLFKPRASVAAVLADARPALTVCAHHRAWIRSRYAVEATVVRCGVDPLRFGLADPGRTRHRAGHSTPLEVVCVARWTSKKGLDTLLSAVEQTTEPVRLRLVADVPGPVPPGVVGGALPPAQIPSVLAASDVFALPCRVAPDGDRDGVPVALMEAMASGLPVITTPVSGIPELVDDTVGWLVAPDEPQALASALDAVARDPEARAVHGDAGRVRVAEEWTLARQVDGLLAAWGAS